MLIFEAIVIKVWMSALSIFGNRKASMAMPIFLGLTVICPAVSGQYLRDSTDFRNKEEFYPSGHLLMDNFDSSAIYPLTFENIFGIPEVSVEFDKREYALFFDFGSKDYFTITDELDHLEYQVLKETTARNPDGSFRGISKQIVISHMKVFDREFHDLEGDLTNWSVFASRPFNGMVGLKILEDFFFTLDYQEKVIAISSKPPDKLMNDKTEIISLLNLDYHPYGVHCKGKVNGRDVLIYFDTGKSVSLVNQDLLSDQRLSSDKTGTYYPGEIEVIFGTNRLALYYPRVRELRRNTGHDLDVGIEIGSDILRYFLISIDRSEGRNRMIVHH